MSVFEYQVVARFETGHEVPRADSTRDRDRAERQFAEQAAVVGWKPTTIVLRYREVGPWQTLEEADRPVVGGRALACPN